MSALVMAVAVLVGSGDGLAKTSLGRLSFKAPTAWTAASDDASSKSWAAEGDVAQFSVSAYPVEPARPASACVDEMLEKLGRQGFSAVKLGGQPAQKKVDTDFVGGADAGQSEKDKVTTTTVIGCDGKVRWVMTWSSRTSMGARFGPMLKRVLDSIAYGT